MRPNDKETMFMRVQKLNNSGIRFNSRCLAYFDNMLVVFNSKLNEIDEKNFRSKQ